MGPGALAIVSKLARSQLSSTRDASIAPASLMAWVLVAQCAIGAGARALHFPSLALFPGLVLGNSFRRLVPTVLGAISSA